MPWIAARDNARGARDAVSTEMWECLNTTWQALPSRRRAAERIGSYTYVAYVRERAALLSGLAESTMSHDEGYQFLVLGRSLERLDMMTRLLSVQALRPRARAGWTTLLRAAEPEGAYLRSFGANVTAQSAAEFLLLDRLFPRSAVAALTDAEDALLDIAGSSESTSEHTPGGRSPIPARRYIGQARTRLEYADTGNLLAELPGLLRSLQDAGGRSSRRVSRRFFQHGNAVAVGPRGSLSVRRSRGPSDGRPPPWRLAIVHETRFEYDGSRADVVQRGEAHAAHDVAAVGHRRRSRHLAAARRSSTATGTTGARWSRRSTCPSRTPSSRSSRGPRWRRCPRPRRRTPSTGTS